MRYLSFQQKILALPAVATLALLVLLALTYYLGKRNEELIVRIQTVFSPAYELSRDLQEQMAEIQQGLQGVVQLEDPGQMPGVDGFEVANLTPFLESERRATNYRNGSARLAILLS